MVSKNGRRREDGVAVYPDPGNVGARRAMHDLFEDGCGVAGLEQANATGFRRHVDGNQIEATEETKKRMRRGGGPCVQTGGCVGG